MNRIYKDSVANLASAMTKKKKTNGTADTQARRAGESGVASKDTGTKTGMPHHIPRANRTPYVYYHTTGSSNREINDGKRFTSNKEMKGSKRIVMENAETGKNEEVWDEYTNKITASDAIVKPRVRALARLKKSQESPDATVTPRTRR